MIHSFHMPVDVRYGPGALAALETSAALGSRPAILCGSGSARRHGHLDAVLKFVPHARVFEGCPENPTYTDCDQYAEGFRSAQIDFIIALGGGSVMDAAKAIALLLGNGGACRDYAGQPVPHAPLPVIAIPTTAGTGSEVTPYAVLVDEVANKKVTLRAPGLFPRLAILDPALTTTVPPEVTVATALDALSQGMEGMLSLKSTPLGDTLALDVCHRVYEGLPRVLENPRDLEARGTLLYAAMLSGVIIAQSGTTLVHGMGYPYTLDYGIAHGAANALLLPPLFWWNAMHVPDKVAALAPTLGQKSDASPTAAAAAITDALYGFYRKIHFSPSAKEHDVPEGALVDMAHGIANDPYRFKNQVGTLTETQVYSLYHASWVGTVAGLEALVPA